MDQVVPKLNSPYFNINSGVKRNMVSGFCATGVRPFNRNKVLDKLLREEVTEQEVESTLTTFLKESRYGNSSGQATRKKKRLDVAPGKSISTQDDNNMVVPLPGTSSQRHYVTLESSKNLEPTETNQLDPVEEETNLGPIESNQEEPEDVGSVDSNIVEEEDEEAECTVGRFVLVKFYTKRGNKQTYYLYICLSNYGKRSSTS
ncbi:hypothetical protein O0L34_g9359 [Tuta absoluta]|nr:hypothetical protein O0L34_g9359 [Tuta absoluta]